MNESEIVWIVTMITLKCYRPIAKDLSSCKYYQAKKYTTTNKSNYTHTYTHIDAISHDNIGAVYLLFRFKTIQKQRSTEPQIVTNSPELKSSNYYRDDASNKESRIVRDDKP